MRDWRILLCITLLVSFRLSAQPRGLTPATPNSPTRRALLIGNQTYLRKPLKNPVHDAQDLGQSLEQLGFKTQVLTNSAKPQILAAAQAFAASLGPGDTGLLFYSGHGLQIDAENYLVPVDFSATSESQARAQAVPFGEIKDALERTPA